MNEHQPCHFITERVGEALAVESLQTLASQAPVIEQLAAAAEQSAPVDPPLANLAEKALTALACNTCLLDGQCPLQKELQQREQQSAHQLAGILNILA